MVIVGCFLIFLVVFCFSVYSLSLVFTVKYDLLSSAPTYEVSLTIMAFEVLISCMLLLIFETVCSVSFTESTTPQVPKRNITIIMQNVNFLVLPLTTTHKIFLD